MQYVVTIVGLLVVQGGFWALLQSFSPAGRQGRKAEIARQEAAIEIDREKAATDRETAEVARLKVVAEARVIQQQGAIDDFEHSNDRLREDLTDCERQCNRCRQEVRELREGVTAVVDVFALFVAKMRAAADENSGVIILKVSGDEFLGLRRAISDARLKLE